MSTLTNNQSINPVMPQMFGLIYNWRLIGGGEGIHWDDLDEDILVEGLLR